MDERTSHAARPLAEAPESPAAAVSSVGTRTRLCSQRWPRERHGRFPTLTRSAEGTLLFPSRVCGSAGPWDLVPICVLGPDLLHCLSSSLDRWLSGLLLAKGRSIRQQSSSTFLTFAHVLSLWPEQVPPKPTAQGWGRHARRGRAALHQGSESRGQHSSPARPWRPTEHGLSWALEEPEASGYHVRRCSR